MAEVSELGLISKVVGQSGAKETLARSLHSGRLAPVQLFVGPSGVGKGQMALALAQILLCERRGSKPPLPPMTSVTSGSAAAPTTPTSELWACGVCGSCQRVARRESESLLWLEPEGAQIKLEQAHQLLEFLSLKSWGESRVVILAGADALSPQAANALLKILEEPPENSFVLLLASQLAAVLPTLRSRSQVLRFQPLSSEELRQALALRAQSVGADDAKAKDTAQAEAFPDWILEASQGRLDVAEQWLDSELLETKQVFFSSLNHWLSGQLSLTDLMESLNPHLSSLSQGLFVSGLLQQALRDALFVRFGLEPLIHSDQRPLLQTLAASNKLFDQVEESFQLERDLKANVERRLCFEALFYGWAQASRGALGRAR